MFKQKEISNKNVRNVKDRDKNIAPRKVNAISNSSEPAYIISEEQVKNREEEFFKNKNSGIFLANQDPNFSSRISSEYYFKGKYGAYYDNLDLGSFLPVHVEPNSWSDEPLNFSISVKPLENGSISIADGDSNNNVYRALAFYKGNAYIMNENKVFLIAENIDVNKWHEVSFNYHRNEDHVFSLKDLEQDNLLYSADFANTNSNNELPERIFVRSIGTVNGTIVGPDESEDSIEPLKGAFDNLVIDENPWYNHDQEIAKVGADENWEFYKPSPGDIAHIEKENHYIKFRDSELWRLVDSGRDAEEISIYKSDWKENAEQLDEGTLIENNSLKIDV